MVQSSRFQRNTCTRRCLKFCRARQKTFPNLTRHRAAGPRLRTHPEPTVAETQIFIQFLQQFHNFHLSVIPQFAIAIARIIMNPRSGSRPPIRRRSRAIVTVQVEPGSSLRLLRVPSTRVKYANCETYYVCLQVRLHSRLCDSKLEEAVSSGKGFLKPYNRQKRFTQKRFRSFQAISII